MTKVRSAAIWPFANIAAFPASISASESGIGTGGNSREEMASIAIIPWVFMCQVVALCMLRLTLRKINLRCIPSDQGRPRFGGEICCSMTPHLRPNLMTRALRQRASELLVAMVQAAHRSAREMMPAAAR